MVFFFFSIVFISTIFLLVTAANKATPERTPEYFQEFRSERIRAQVACPRWFRGKEIIFLQKKTYILFYLQDGVVHLWDSESGHILQRLGGHQSTVYSAVWNSHQQLLVRYLIGKNKKGRMLIYSFFLRLQLQ